MPTTSAVPAKESTTPKKLQKESAKKWGRLVSARYTLVPAVLLEKQRELKLDPVKMNILLQLLSFWWRASDLPWPSKKTLAKRLGVDPTTIRRHIIELEENELLSRVYRRDEAKGQQTNAYDLKPLVRKLRTLAEQERKNREKNRNGSTYRG